MADFARYLPLSYRPPQDESQVTSHWGQDIAGLLRATASLLDGRPESAWEAPSLNRGWSVRESVGYLVVRLGTPTGELVRTIAFATAENAFRSRAAAESLARRAASASTDELIASLLGIAEDKAAGRGRTGIRELAIATVGALDIGGGLGARLRMRPTASGAVALRRALAAPTEITAVVRGRTLMATDADWSFGRGPEMADTAENILRFLYGRSDRAPGMP